MNKLDYELINTFGSTGNKDIALAFINALTIEEVKPLQEWLKRAELEQVIFPDGLSKDELFKELRKFYNVYWIRLENFAYLLSGVYEQDDDKVQDIVWEVYTTDIDRFRVELDRVTDKSYKCIVKPMKRSENYDARPKIDIEEANRCLKSLEKLFELEEQSKEK